jgi:hypothetical protein
MSRTLQLSSSWGSSWAEGRGGRSKVRQQSNLTPNTFRHIRPQTQFWHRSYDPGLRLSPILTTPAHSRSHPLPKISGIFSIAAACVCVCMLSPSSVRIILSCHYKSFGGVGLAVGTILELERTPSTPHLPIYRSRRGLVNHQSLMPPTLESNNGFPRAVIVPGLLYTRHDPPTSQCIRRPLLAAL